MILLWIIISQKKWEKECKENGWTPAVSMKERLQAYLMVIVLPIILGLLLRK